MVPPAAGPSGGVVVTSQDHHAVVDVAVGDTEEAHLVVVVDTKCRVTSHEVVACTVANQDSTVASTSDQGAMMMKSRVAVVVGVGEVEGALTTGGGDQGKKAREMVHR